MKYLIDTNICIYILNKRPAGVIKRFKEFEPGDMAISTVSISELQYGIAKSKLRKKNQLRLEEFLIPLELLMYDQKAATAYGEIRYQSEKRGQSIGPYDLLIAAQAISRCLTLVTNNDKEFNRIKGLAIENWTK